MKPLKTGSQQRFEIAIRQSPVKDCPVETIKNVLRMVMLKVGIRAANLPNNEEKAVLLNHVLTEYKGHSPEEILLAFDMAIAGKLEIDDVNCFENFSCVYFSKIMNAYRKWSAQEYKELKTEQPVVQRILTDQQIEDLQRKDIEEFYQRCRNRQIPYAIPDYFKDVLVKDGLIKSGDLVSNFFSERLGNGSKNIYLPI